MNELPPRPLLEERKSIHDCLKALSSAAMRFDQLSSNTTAALFNAGYQAALDDVARSLGLNYQPPNLPLLQLERPA